MAEMDMLDIDALQNRIKELDREVEELKERNTEHEEDLKEAKAESDRWFSESMKYERKYKELKKAFINFVEDMEL